MLPFWPGDLSNLVLAFLCFFFLFVGLRCEKSTYKVDHSQGPVGDYLDRKKL